MVIDQAKTIIDRVLRKAAARLGDGIVAPSLPGKMLRTSLAAHIVQAGAVKDAHVETVAVVCAATELAHTATLCHDDVIDSGVQRRGRPTLWRIAGPSAAVLIGDILLCEGANLLLELDCRRYMAEFMAKIREVCLTEAEQELTLRGRALDEATCLRVARGKTGPLFALPCDACGANDPELSAALDEAGYRIGAAYQLADDLIDIAGDEQAAGKTLRTDLTRGKFTLPRLPDGPHRTGERIAELLDSAAALLAPWPEARRGVEMFLAVDLKPVLNRFLELSPSV